MKILLVFLLTISCIQANCNTTTNDDSITYYLSNGSGYIIKIQGETFELMCYGKTNNGFKYCKGLVRNNGKKIYLVPHQSNCPQLFDLENNIDTSIHMENLYFSIFSSSKQTLKLSNVCYVTKNGNVKEVKNNQDVDTSLFIYKGDTLERYWFDSFYISQDSIDYLEFDVSNQRVKCFIQESDHMNHYSFSYEKLMNYFIIENMSYLSFNILEDDKAYIIINEEKIILHKTLIIDDMLNNLFRKFYLNYY